MQAELGYRDADMGGWIETAAQAQQLKAGYVCTQKIAD